MNGGIQALVFMAAGMALSMLKEAPKRIVGRLLDLFTVHVTVDNQSAVHWVAAWLAHLPYGRTCRRLKIHIAWREYSGPGHDSKVSAVEFEPGEGPHAFRYHGRWIFLSRGEERNEQWTDRRSTLNLRIMGRDRAWLERVVRDAVAYGIAAQRELGLVRVNSESGQWLVLDVCSVRQIGTVLLPGDELARVREDMERFLAARELYGRRGVPYRRGYLFSGPPGTGKTSLAKALANELGLTLFVLDLSGTKTSDLHLFSLLAAVPPRSMVLVEDIDRSRPVQQGPGEDGGVTMSGLLNAVDGPLAGEDRVLVFTTNHPDKLDPALQRPGRVDYRLDFGPAQSAQARELFLRFFPGEWRSADAFAAGLDSQGWTVADLQGRLLGARSADEALAALGGELR